MSKGILESAKYSDAFRTESGNKAIYVRFDRESGQHVLLVDFMGKWPSMYGYDNDGVFGSGEDLERNIVGVWEDSVKIKAMTLVEAYFDRGKTILVKDAKHGVVDWVSIKEPNYWTYLEAFIKNVDKYKIIDN